MPDTMLKETKRLHDCVLYSYFGYPLQKFFDREEYIVWIMKSSQNARRPATFPSLEAAKTFVDGLLRTSTLQPEEAKDANPSQR